MKNRAMICATREAHFTSNFSPDYKILQVAASNNIFMLLGCRIRPVVSQPTGTEVCRLCKGPVSADGPWASGTQQPSSRCPRSGGP